VLVGEPTFPGCVIRARPVGLFAKILAVPVRDPEWSRIESLADVSPHLLREIMHFFAKTTRVGDWKDGEAAWRRIHDGADRLRRRARSAS
jgi:inorganic pyrophosphatase